VRSRAIPGDERSTGDFARALERRPVTTLTKPVAIEASADPKPDATLSDAEKPAASNAENAA